MCSPSTTHDTQINLDHMWTGWKDKAVTPSPTLSKVFSHKVLATGFPRLIFSSESAAPEFDQTEAFGGQTVSKCVTLAKIFCVSSQILILIQTPLVSSFGGEADALVLVL